MNINPEYQRDVVWTPQRMTHLIDSLFNNYYVPPLIFKVVSGHKPGTNERRRWRTCIDGKQRLTAIQRFFDGELPYIDKQKRKWYYRVSNNVKGAQRLLPQEEREFIENVQIVNIEYEHLTEEQEEDMFQRVQLGVPLTGAEKLAALNGKLPSFINDLRDAYTDIPDLITTKRSIDFRLVASLVCLMYNRLQEGEDLKLNVGLVPLKAFLESKDFSAVLTPAFRANARRVFTKYAQLLQSHPDVFTHTYGPPSAKMRRFSPVEFLGVGILLDTYPDRPIRVLAEDIRTFRHFLREKFHDLRTNSSVWTVVMEFITTLEERRGYYPPENEIQNGRSPVRTAPLSPRRNSAFQPPPPEQQIHSQRPSIYNERQQALLDRRTAEQRQEHRDAFQRIPTERRDVHESNGTHPANSQPEAARTRDSTIPSKRTLTGAPIPSKRTLTGAVIKRENGI